MAAGNPPRECERCEDIGEDDNSEFWAAYSRRILGCAPDIVFTSEDMAKHTRDSWGVATSWSIASAGRAGLGA